MEYCSPGNKPRAILSMSSNQSTALASRRRDHVTYLIISYVYASPRTSDLLPRLPAFVFRPCCPLVDSSSSVPPLSVPQTLLLKTPGLPILRQPTSQNTRHHKKLPFHLTRDVRCPSRIGSLFETVSLWDSVLRFVRHSFVRPFIFFSS